METELGGVFCDASGVVPSTGPDGVSSGFGLVTGAVASVVASVVTSSAVAVVANAVSVVH